MNDRERLEAAIEQINKSGGYAWANLGDCQSCGWAEVRNNLSLRGLTEAQQEKVTVVFWHEQDDEGAFGREVEYDDDPEYEVYYECPECAWEWVDVNVDPDAEADCPDCGEGDVTPRDSWAMDPEEIGSSPKDDLEHPLYLAWQGDLLIIMEALVDNGFTVAQPRDTSSRIMVLPEDYDVTRIDADRYFPVGGE